jgi:predicted transposase/invertase (TIGR01784 family)
MTKKLSPHDRFTRSSMSHPKVSKEFFQKHLPEKIKNIMDFSSIELQKESYIDDNLKQQIADLLFSVKFNKQPGFLYVLFEHASRSDPLLPFRILKYMVAIMDNHLKTKKTHKLPLVYPMVLYTGAKPYAHSMDIFDLFLSGEKELAKEIMPSPYHLIDLTQISDEELMHYRMFGLMGCALKHIHDPNILPFFMSILDDIRELERLGEESYIYSMVTYIYGVGKTPHQGDFIEAVKRLEFIEEENIMPTILEYLKPELLRRVKAQGIEKGIEQVAKAMLSKGIDVNTIASVTGHSKEEIKKLLN